MSSFLEMLFGKRDNADQEIGSFEDREDYKFNKADQEIGSFEDRTVSWHPTNARPGDAIHIHYHGALKNAGANDLFLHYGFDGWHTDINTIKMAKNDDGDFVAEVKAAADREVNFCFKDIKGNWDNNHGKDWALPLQD